VYDGEHIMGAGLVQRVLVLCVLLPAATGTRFVQRLLSPSGRGRDRMVWLLGGGRQKAPHLLRVAPTALGERARVIGGVPRA